MALPALATLGMYFAGRTAQEEARTRDNASKPPLIPPEGSSSFREAKKYYSPFEQPNIYNVDAPNFGNYFQGPRRIPHGLPENIRSIEPFGEGGRWNLNKTGADEPPFGSESDRPIRRLGSTTTPEDIAARQSLYNQLYNPDLPFTGRNNSNHNYRIAYGASVAMHHRGSPITVLPADRFVPQDYPQQRDTVLGPYQPPEQQNRQGFVSLNNKTFKTFDERTQRATTVLRLANHVDRIPLRKQGLLSIF